MIRPSPRRAAAFSLRSKTLKAEPSRFEKDEHGRTHRRIVGRGGNLCIGSGAIGASSSPARPGRRSGSHPDQAARSPTTRFTPPTSHFMQDDDRPSPPGGRDGGARAVADQEPAIADHRRPHPRLAEGRGAVHARLAGRARRRAAPAAMPAGIRHGHGAPTMEGMATRRRWPRWPPPRAASSTACSSTLMTAHHRGALDDGRGACSSSPARPTTRCCTSSSAT